MGRRGVISSFNLFLPAVVMCRGGKGGGARHSVIFTLKNDRESDCRVEFLCWPHCMKTYPCTCSQRDGGWGGG